MFSILVFILDVVFDTSFPTPPRIIPTAQRPPQKQMQVNDTDIISRNTHDQTLINRFGGCVDFSFYVFAGIEQSGYPAICLPNPRTPLALIFS